MRFVVIQKTAMRHRKHRKGKRRRGGKRKKAGRLVISDHLPPLMQLYPDRQNNSIPDFFNSLCVPKKAYYTIYKHIEQREMFVALENNRKNLVEVWHWTLGQVGMSIFLLWVNICKQLLRFSFFLFDHAFSYGSRTTH